MKTITKTYEVYNFDELSKEAQAKVIHKLCNINVDFDWFDFMIDDFRYLLKSAGIQYNNLYWSIDRDYYIYMQNPIISYNNNKTFLKAYAGKIEGLPKGEKLKYSEVKEILIDGISIQNYYGSTKTNYIENEKLDRWLKEVLNQFLKDLQQQYDWLLSEEAIKDTIKANDYQFLKDGTIFYE